MRRPRARRNPPLSTDRTNEFAKRWGGSDRSTVCVLHCTKNCHSVAVYDLFCSLRRTRMSVSSLPRPRSWVSIGTWILAASVTQLTSRGPASATRCLPLLQRAPPLELELFTQNPSRVLSYALSDDGKLEDKVTVYLSTNPEVTTAIRELLINTPS